MTGGRRCYLWTVSGLLTTAPASANRSGVSFGIDIGGTGIKGAPVDLATGELAGQRVRFATPQPSTPDDVADVARRLVERHEWHGPVGVCMPSVITHGVVGSTANIDSTWLGVDGERLFADAIGRPVHLFNDADAAGLAEMTWGAGRGRSGVVICLTFGTGIGSAVFIDGELVPNTELGHLELDGHVAERRAAASARRRDELGWKAWAKRVDRYLGHLVMLFSPELIILGGGASKRAEKWFGRLDPGCELAVAALTNDAGIAGAAMSAPRSR